MPVQALRTTKIPGRQEALHSHATADAADAATPEPFGLSWPGKQAAKQLAATPPRGLLTPMPGQGVDEDTTRNIFIEGENLDALKLLQHSHAGRIKLIYIDPPYNTGKNFVYKDKYTHSDWLSMMYPRLALARELMTDDGLIFISIDHHENAHLKILMNELFGEEHFVADIVWKHAVQSKNDEDCFSRQYNNILVYSRSGKRKKFRLPRSEANNRSYSNPDNDPKGAWRSGDTRSPSFRKTLRYPILTPSKKKLAPPKNGWRWSEKELLKKIAGGEIIFAKDERKIIRKIYLADQEGRTPENLWMGKEFGTTRSANTELKELLGGEIFFDTPKPTALLMQIMSLLFEEKDFIVLDFFAGSGTTGHAVYKKNLVDNGTRQFICIQWDEEITTRSSHRPRFRTISDLAKERLRNTTGLLKEENKGTEVDLGFKVFKLHLKDSL